MTWEQRMADKAASRRSKQEVYWAEQAASLGQDYMEAEDYYVEEVAADLTVEDALVMQEQMGSGAACACMGGISCCIVRRRAIEQVLGGTNE